jgi:AraC-like DNA-binding protein
MRVSGGASTDQNGGEGPGHFIDLDLIEPVRTTPGADGAVRLSSALPVLVAVNGIQAVLEPSSLSIGHDSVLCLPPSGEYSIRTVPAEDHLEVAAIHFAIRFYGVNAPLLLPGEPHLFARDNALDLRQLIFHFSSTTGAGHSTEQRATRLSQGYKLAAILARAFDIDGPGRAEREDTEPLQDLLAYLHRHYAEQLTAESLAAACNVSRRSLFRIAAQLDGLTPMKLLKRIRLEHSLILLREESLQIGQVARMVGFSDVSHFSREFKSAYHMTALRFREQTVMGSLPADMLARAEKHSERGNYGRAADLYEKAAQSIPRSLAADQLLYQAGLAYKQAGDVVASDRVWAGVTSVRQRNLITLEKTASDFRSFRHRRVLAALREVYHHGDADLRGRTAGLLSNYMSDCTNAERYAAARLYCEFAKQLAPAHPEIHAALGHSLYQTGQFLEVREYCPTQRGLVAAALRMAGMFREHLREFPDSRAESARIYRRMGRFDIVLDAYQDIPHDCVDALCDMGRYQEAVERYPGHCAPALLALKQYRQVLERFPEDTPHCVWALALMGKHERALERARLDPWLQATVLLYLERVDDILSSALFEQTYRNAATMLKVFLLLERNQAEEALSELARVKRVADHDFKWGQDYYLPELAAPFIRHVLGMSAAAAHTASEREWRDRYRQTAEKVRYSFQQRLWYDLQYLLDECDDAAYLQQPYCNGAAQRLVPLKAMKAEYAGDSSEAAVLYTQFQERLAGESLTGLDWGGSVFGAFARWRLKELAEKA